LAFPVYVDLLGLQIHPHVLFESLGYFAGFRLYLWQRRRRGDVIGTHDRWSVVAGAILGAALGAKLLYLLENPAETVARWRDVSYLLSGKSLVGGLLGGLIGVEVTKRFAGIAPATGDLFAIPLAVGVAIGRVGCFLTGLADRTHGVGTTLPWGVDFGDGVPRHPTQLYELAFLAALVVALARLAARTPVQGDLFKAFMVSYLAFRLLVDAIKPDVALALGLSSIQWACLASLAYYAWILRTRLVRRPEL